MAARSSGGRVAEFDATPRRDPPVQCATGDPAKDAALQGRLHAPHDFGQQVQGLLSARSSNASSDSRISSGRSRAARNAWLRTVPPAKS